MCGVYTICNDHDRAGMMITAMLLGWYDDDYDDDDDDDDDDEYDDYDDDDDDDDYDGDDDYGDDDVSVLWKPKAAEISNKDEFQDNPASSYQLAG